MLARLRCALKQRRAHTLHGFYLWLTGGLWRICQFGMSCRDCWKSLSRYTRNATKDNRISPRRTMSPVPEDGVFSLGSSFMSRFLLSATKPCVFGGMLSCGFARGIADSRRSTSEDTALSMTPKPPKPWHPESRFSRSSHHRRSASRVFQI